MPVSPTHSLSFTWPNVPVHRFSAQSTKSSSRRESSLGFFLLGSAIKGCKPAQVVITASGEQAEAYFYEALTRWRVGDPGDAKLLMRKVLGTGRMAFFEYDMAQNYLEWNDLPARARPPR